MFKNISVKIVPNAKYSRNSYINMLTDNLGINVNIVDDISFFERKSKTIIHYNWTESILSKKSFLSFIFSLFRTSFELCLNNFFSFKNVLTVHNIFPHDYYNPRYVKLYKYFILDFFHGFVFLNEKSLNDFIQFYSVKSINNYCIISHGHYRSLLNDNFSFYDLKLNNKLLFFGQIRRYKNVESIVDEFLIDDSKVFKLVLVGSPNYNLKYFEQLKYNSMLDVNFSFVSDEELFSIIYSSRAIVLPYKKILNSGSIFLALSLNKVVFVHSNLVLYDLEYEIQMGYIVRYKDYRDLKIKFMSLNGGIQIFDLSRHNWSRISSSLTDFYSRILKT